MQHPKAFTLIELVVTIFILFIVVGLLMPTSGCRSRTVANRIVCAANLTGIHKAMYTYSVTNKNDFPKYSATTPQNPIQPLDKITGFQIRDRSRSSDSTTPQAKLKTLLQSGALTNNGTAALFKLVRDGSASTKSFLCPSDINAEVDTLAQISQPNQGYLPVKPTPKKAPNPPYGAAALPAHLQDIYDFGQPQSLSYSFINMYNKQAGRNWSSNAAADWVIMSDDNNAPRERKYFKSPEVSPKQLAQHENSQTHSQGEGQNFLFGDGHVKFSVTPFQGPKGDNAMAAGPTQPTDDSEATPLKQPLRNNDGLIRDADKFTDVVLISISAKDQNDNYRPWSLASTQKQN